MIALVLPCLRPPVFRHRFGDVVGHFGVDDIVLFDLRFHHQGIGNG